MSNATPDTILPEDKLNIHSIESFGTYDGPGIRFVVFLQGCPFQCLYCANPDTMRFEDGKPYSMQRIVEEAEHMKSYFANGGGITISGGEPCCQAKQLITLFKNLQSKGIHTCLDTNGHVMNHYVKKCWSIPIWYYWMSNTLILRYTKKSQGNPMKKPWPLHTI